MANQYTRFLKFTDDLKECSQCKLLKKHSEFHKDTNRYGLAYYCKECACANSRRHHARRMTFDVQYKDNKRNSYILNTHGITSKEYEAKLEAQNYTCAICKVRLLARGHGTHLDHSHKTGEIRAMLCTNCNRGLGHFKDSTVILQNAIIYLDSHSRRCSSGKEVCPR